MKKNTLMVGCLLLFVLGSSFAMADGDHRDDRGDNRGDRDHAKVRIVIHPKKHHRRPKRHVETHSSISLKIGGGDDHHDDHDDHR